MTRSPFLTILAAIALLAACGDNAFEPFDGREEFDWSGAIGAGRTLEIKGIAGSITVTSAAVAEAEVNAVKRGRDDDPAAVDIVVVRHTGGVTICALYPDVAGEPANICLPGLQGHLGSRNNDVQVDFTVRLPAGVHFTGVNVSGNVAANVQGDAFATTVSGNIEITASGIASATTVSGSIDARVGKADWGRDLSFTAVSGNVTVEVPSNTNASVVATTVSGSVSSDFPLGGTARSRAGDLGEGGPRLGLTTVSGNVRLRRGSAG